MLLSKISFYNFRNFHKNEFTFSPSLTIIFGDNARGKTNLLEGIYCITHGTGFRETKEEELVKIGEKSGKINSIFSDKKAKTELQINFNRNNSYFEKKYFVNKTNQRFAAYQQELVKSILFSPQQLETITGSPDIRRQYLDHLISFYDMEYKKELTNYDNAIRKRNKILETYHSEKQLIEELFFWDDYLEEQAEYITGKRSTYMDFLNQHQKLDSKRFSIKYFANKLTKVRLKEIFDREKLYRRTLIGPQKDDWQIFMDEKNLHLFGSRSEQRLGIFWLKINEIKFYEEKYKQKPILLLDDVFSELDQKNKKLILELIKKYQTVTTTAEKEVIDLINSEKTIISLLF